jgi:hypothetical protein
MMICNFPNADNLQGFDVTADYNGHGTTVGDILLGIGIPLVVGLTIVLMMFVYWHHNTKRRSA